MTSTPTSVDGPQAEPIAMTPVDRAESAFLGWPLAALLATICVFYLAVWTPMYMTWPWFTDHDHCALAAQEWSRGRVLYREYLTSQFPGEIYLYRALGEWAGWGNTAAFYGVDAAMVMIFGGMLVLWSRRRFGRTAPGWFGLLSFLAYYLAQDFWVAGQREWHATFLGVAAFLLLDLLPGRFGRVAAGLALGAAMSVRPQVVLIIPGLIVALDRVARPRGGPWSKTLTGLAESVVAASLMLFVAFLPLILAGTLPNFIRSLRGISHGVGLALAPSNRLLRFFSTFGHHPELVFVTMALVAIACRRKDEDRRGPLAIILALLGACFTDSISPDTHDYYYIPAAAFLGITAAEFVGLSLRGRMSKEPTVVILLLLASILAGQVPQTVKVGVFTQISDLVKAPKDVDNNVRHYGPITALGYLRRGELPERLPTGYRQWRHVQDRYPWTDYRDLIEYLRRETTPDTPVVSLLFECVASVPAAVPRPMPMPCDSIAMTYGPELPPGAVEILETTRDCVVVWDPTLPEGRDKKLKPLFDVVRAKYRHQATFGRFEVWRRMPDPPQ